MCVFVAVFPCFSFFVRSHPFPLFILAGQHISDLEDVPLQSLKNFVRNVKTASASESPEHPNKKPRKENVSVCVFVSWLFCLSLSFSLSVPHISSPPPHLQAFYQILGEMKAYIRQAQADFGDTFVVKLPSTLPANPHNDSPIEDRVSFVKVRVWILVFILSISVSHYTYTHTAYTHAHTHTHFLGSGYHPAGCRRLFLARSFSARKGIVSHPAISTSWHEASLHHQQRLEEGHRLPQDSSVQVS